VAQQKLNIDRDHKMEDLVKATLDALLQETRILGSTQAAAGLGVGLAVTGAAVLGLDIAGLINWPLTVTAVVGGAIGVGGALTALSVWQWNRGEARIKQLEKKLWAVRYAQRQAASTGHSQYESPARGAFGRKQVLDAQETADELLRRVMLRPKDPT
jgi:hypothetical protein